MKAKKVFCKSCVPVRTKVLNGFIATFKPVGLSQLEFQLYSHDPIPVGQPYELTLKPLDK